MTETTTPRRWRRITTTIGLAAVALVAMPTLASAAGSVTVIDGDTLVLDGEKIRIQGIDTPEVGEPCHDEATEALRALVAGGALEVTQRDGTDRYTRTIAMLRVDGVDVGLAMIQSGLARARYDSRDGYGRHPNEFLYHALQRETVCTTVDGPVTYPGPVGDTTTYPDAVEPEQGETTPPFWTWAVLGAVAAENGIPFDGGASFTAEHGDTGAARTAAAAAIWFATAAKHEAEAAAEAARVEAERAAAAAAERAERAEREAAAAAKAAEQEAQEAARPAPHPTARPDPQPTPRPQSSDWPAGVPSDYHGPRCYAPGGKTWTPC